MVFNATFNNISVLSWRLVSLVEDTGEPGENHRSVANYWQTSAITMSLSSGVDCYTHCSTVTHVLLASFPNVTRWRCNSHCLDVTTYFFLTFPQVLLWRYNFIIEGIFNPCFYGNVNSKAKIYSIDIFNWLFESGLICFKYITLKNACSNRSPTTVTLYLLRRFLSYICNNRLWNNYNIDIVNLLVVCLCMGIFFFMSVV
jgi:hypothetical protein